MISTWEHVLSKESDFPNDWMNMHEVLVGSRLQPESHTIPIWDVHKCIFSLPPVPMAWL